MAAKVLLDLCRPHWWIQGNRYAASEQYSEKAEKVLATGGQHYGHCLSGLEVSLSQPGSYCFRSLFK
jgi:hypothetical protein